MTKYVDIVLQEDCTDDEVENEAVEYDEQETLTSPADILILEKGRAERLNAFLLTNYCRTVAWVRNFLNLLFNAKNKKFPILQFSHVNKNSIFADPSGPGQLPPALCVISGPGCTS